MAQQFSQNPLNQYQSEDLAIGWPWRFFAISFGILVLSIGIYFAMTLYYEPLLNRRTEEAAAEFQKVSAGVSKEDQEKFTLFYSQITNLKNLLANHVIGSRVFVFLEKVTHPEVYYRDVNIRISERELELNGVSNSFTVLGEQLEAFNQAEEVDHYLVRQSQVEEGKVQFKVLLTLKNNLLK
ncbi:MAG: hypothetical protein HZB99_04825 [Candidatus Harrisonbacteria bacterium]|nr:hypothetical protein [Candidatus Harrisonbacteria bacterium]